MALVIYVIRARDRDTITGPGLYVGNQSIAVIEQVPNITQRLVQQYEDSYTPQGSTTTAASYPGRSS